MTIKRLLLFLVMVAAIPLLSSAQVIPAPERQALEDLYNSTYGPGWANSTDWLTADESTWFGVTVTGGHVTAIALPGNNLDGTVPVSITQLTELTDLNLGNNHITALPNQLGTLASLVTLDLSANQLSFIPEFTSTALSTLHLENNKLIFEFIELNLTVPVFSYSPQANLPGGSYTFGPGEYGVVINGASMPGNYQWYLNGEVIAGQTGTSLQFYPFSFANAGTYYYEITKTSVPGLTLRSDPFVVTAKSCVSASERDALIALYNATNGEAWYTNTNWLTSAPVEQWYGVVVDDCHVSSIYMPSNLLDGTLPVELGNLVGLASLDLSGNGLHGTIPAEMANLTQLQWFLIGGNQLEGTVPTGIGSFQNLFGVGISNNSLDGIPTFTSTHITYFDIEQNRMTFEDIAVNAGIAGYDFTPQAPTLPTQYVSAVPAAPVTFLASDTEVNNSYLWYKNGVLIPGETSSSYALPAVAFGNEGEYSVEITNSIFTGMTFTESFVLIVSNGSTIPLTERAALISLYHATGGESWANQTGWLSANESTWTGVTVTGGHVTALDLSGNTLVGVLPPSIGDLTFLQFLDLSSNSLSGAVPASLAAITSLTQIDLSLNILSGLPEFTNTAITSLVVNNNQLDFDDLLLNVNVPGLVYIFQQPHSFPVYNVFVNQGMPVELRGYSYTEMGAGFEYQWNHESTPIAGASASNYAIVAASVGDIGTYTLDVSHPFFPGLTITGYFDYLNVDAFTPCIPQSEYEALVNLYQALGGTTWIRNDYWLTNDPSGWYGVTISGCHVTELDLSGNKLFGTLPSSIGQFPFLTRLDLHGNQLSDAVPDELSNLTALEFLDLSYNDFDNDVPASIGNVATLQTVKLQANHITGIPAFLGAALTSMDVSSNNLDFGDLEPTMATPGLVYLPQANSNVPFNQTAIIGSPVGLLVSANGTANHYQWYKKGAAIDGATSSSYVIPSFQLTDEGPYTAKVTNDLVPGLTFTSEFMVVKGGGCVSSEKRAALLWLYYNTRGRQWNNSTNWLSANESSWYGVTTDDCEIEGINLANNNLNGPIPTQVGDISTLLSLELYNNTLSGPIPPSIGGLIGLTVLNLENTGVTGNIPTTLGNFSNMTELNLAYNRLTGNIPAELGNLYSLQTLNLFGNSYYDYSTGLQGGIPATLGELSNLTTLNLGYNQLSGSIPRELGDIPLFNGSDLTIVLANNRLTGSIPVELASANKIYVSGNYLTGQVPPALGLSGLVELDASFNSLTGPIPSNIGDWDQIQLLYLDYNGLSGSIPASIGDMQSLNGFTASYNSLTGAIPTTIGDLPLANTINLQHNQLTGSIPTSLSAIPALTYLNLSENALTGSIPPSLGSISSLQLLFLNLNQLDGTIPTSFGNLTILSGLFLSDNQLTGAIPAEIGNLTNLHDFYAFRNQLSGPIPPELGSLPAIQRIYLEDNQLTGTVPSELGNLATLKGLTLGDNLLTGDLPASIGTISGLITFGIQNNEITSIPAFSSSAITTLAVEENLLDFGDLELNAGKAGYTYSPQNTVLGGGISNPTLGCVLSILMATSGSQNSYQWAFEGVDIAGAVSPLYVKFNATTADNGNYSVTITNTLLPGLTFHSENWVVTAGGSQITPPSVTDGSGCVGSAVTLTASGATGFEEYRWYDVPSGGISLDGTSTFLTPALTDTTEYYVQKFDSEAQCESLRVLVTAFAIDPITPGATGGANCGPGEVILNATGGIPSEYRWYTASSGGTAIAGETGDIYITPSIPSTASYYVSIDKAGCEGTRTAVPATINDIPSAPGTTNTVSCTSPATVSLVATGGSAGEYRWYVDSGTPTPISGEVNGTYITPSISTTTTYFVSINDGLCEGNRSPVDAVVTVLSAPGGTGSSSCDPASLTLNATGGSTGDFRWYTVASGGTALAGETNNTLVTPSLSTTTSYYVAIADAVCESPRTQLDATIVNLGAPTTTDDTFCAPGTALLNASGGAAGEYRWYTLASGGIAIAGEVNAAFTTPSLSSNTSYYVALNDGTCESPRQIVDALAHITSPPATTGATACEGSTVGLIASGGADGQYRWYTVPVAGTAIAGEVNGAFVTPSLTATTPYYVSIDDGTCESTRETVDATIDPLPAAPSATDGSNCGPGVVSLSATGGVNGDYRWYTVAAGGTAIAGAVNDAFISPLLASTTSYFVALSDGTCESIREEAIADILSVPAAPVTADASLCGPGTLSLSATGGASGDYRWYTVATGGTALPGEVADTFTTPVLATTTSYFVALTNGSCESIREEVVADILTIPTAPGVTGASLCGPGAVSLSATGGASGDYRWCTVATGGSAISGEVADTFTTPVLATTTSYFVALTNGSCESIREEVIADILPVPTAPVTTDASLCGPGIVSLSATGGASGDYRWYTVATGGTALPGEVAGTFTTPLLTSTTSYFVSITNGSCESARQEAIADILSMPTQPLATAGSHCGPGNVSLSASGGTNGNYRWYTVATGGTALAGEVNDAFTTPILASTTSYFVALANAACESTREEVVADIVSVPTQPLATDGSNCGPGTVLLTASGGATGNYRWYTVATGGTALAGEVNATFTTPSLTSATSYFVSLANAFCESTRKEVVADILSVPAQPVATGASNCGTGTVLLSASGGANGDYRWYTVATGGTALAGEVNDTFTTPILGSTTSYFVSLANASCESVREEAIATIVPAPLTPTTVDGFNCGPGIVTLSASGGLNGDYRWYTAATGGAPIPFEQSSTFQTPSLTSTTTYYVSLVSASCEGARAPAIAEIRSCTQAPEIEDSESTVTVEGVVTVDLGPLITDPDGDVDLSSLTIVQQPISGALATINGSDLEIDYGGVIFSGIDSLQVRVCDFSGLCTSQWLYVQVIGETEVFNAISPNGDNKNDIFLIQYVDFLPETRRNHVTILNRWGDVVWEGTNYDNQSVVFLGLNKNGNELPSGTYFYKVDFEGNRPSLSGYLSLKR